MDRAEEPQPGGERRIVKSPDAVRLGQNAYRAASWERVNPWRSPMPL